jgi:LAGLIDADG DNA endonuclease family
MVNIYNSNSERRQAILKKRQAFLSDPANKGKKPFTGNTNARKEYLKHLEEIKPKMTPYQEEYAVGLVLGDASVDLDRGTHTARMRIQNSIKHSDWMQHIKDVYREYMGSDDAPQRPSADRMFMCEVQTLKNKTFYDFFRDLFYSPQTGSAKILNIVALYPYLTPVCLASWLCGDGSKADHTKNEGKGLTFHTEGFSKKETEDLAKALSTRYGWDFQAKLDDPKKEHYRIDLSGADYDDFVTKVGPFVHKDFWHRIPSGRRAGSHYGNMTVELRSSLLGSYLQNVDLLVETYQRSF